MKALSAPLIRWNSLPSRYHQCQVVAILISKETTNTYPQLGHSDEFRNSSHNWAIIRHSLELTRKPNRRKKIENDAFKSFKSNFGLLWPWPLTSWPPKLNISCPCSIEHLCQFASKSVHSFSPRDEMHKRGLCRHAVSVRLSVCHVHGFCRNK